MHPEAVEVLWNGVDDDCYYATADERGIWGRRDEPDVELTAAFDDRVGRGEGGCGDVTGDGVEDWMVASEPVSPHIGPLLTVFDEAPLLSSSTPPPTVATFQDDRAAADSSLSNPVQIVCGLSRGGTNAFAVSTPLDPSGGPRAGAVVLLAAPIPAAATLADAAAHWTGMPYDTALGARVLSTAGDVDGDDTTDLWVGSQGYVNGRPNRLWLLPGGASGEHPVTDGLAEISGLAGAQYWGRAADGAADLDGDGVQDLVIAAPNTVGLLHRRGSVLLYTGTTRGRVTEEDADGELIPEVGWGDFGWGVAALQDADGAGTPGVAVTSPREQPRGDHGAVGALRVFVDPFAERTGPASPFSAVVTDGTTGVCADDVVPLADSDGDGRAELVLVCESIVQRLSLPGAGTHSPSEILGEAGWFSDYYEAIGGTVSDAGDLDHDGLEDLFIGGWSYGRNYVGSDAALWVYFGDPGPG